MKINYTKHAKNKFKYATELGWYLSERDIKEAIKNPDSQTFDKQKNVEIVLKEFDARRNIRVIYAKSYATITVVTFYLIKKGRYEK